MKRILLFAPKDSYSQHIALLLKVANFDCTSSESIDEILNWLSTDHLKEAHFDLLLLNSWPDLDNRNSLFKDLVSQLQIPVIYLIRTGAFKPSRDDYNISLCHPENMLKCINTHLHNNSADSGEICSFAALNKGHLNTVVLPCSCEEKAKQNRTVASHIHKNAITNDTNISNINNEQERN